MTANTGDILLVDDDPDLLKLISLRLASAGYRVRTADSGEAALGALAVARPGVVITDLRMPGIDGLQLFEAIHRAHPALPVIILTAHGTIPDAVSATQRGVFGFLTKPFDSQELLQKVAAALRLAGDTPAESPDTSGEWRDRHHHAQPADGGSAPAGAAGRRLRCERADLRRFRYRQGAPGARDPPREPAARQAVRRGELRRDSRAAARVGALRPRARRVLGRGPGAQGPVPGGRRRNDLPGRNRRHAARAAGEAAARAAGGRGPARRRDAADPRRRARRSRPRTATSTRRRPPASSARTCITA